MIPLHINWKVRVKNKVFWTTIIPAVLLLVQAVAGVFGFSLNLNGLGNQLLEVVNSAFALLVLLGIVADPTTAGITDSKLAMTYEEPKKRS